MKLLTEKYDRYALSVSATTRSPREGEMDGVSYFFMNDASFQEMIEKDALIEYAGYVGHYYGTPKQYVEEKLAKGKDVLLEIEMQGAFKVKEKYPDALMIFVTPPSVEELYRRLSQRGTETPDVIDGRMRQAKEEAKYMDRYDYILVNETGQEIQCMEQMHQIIQSAYQKTDQMQNFIGNIREQFNSI